MSDNKPAFGAQRSDKSSYEEWFTWGRRLVFRDEVGVRSIQNEMEADRWHILIERYKVEPNKRM